MKKITLLSLLLVYVHLAAAQVGLTGRRINVDSLEKVLAKKGEDTAKVNVLNMLAMEYRLSDPDKGAITAVQAFTLAEKLGYPQGMMSACNQLGIIYKNKSEFDKALGYYQKGL